MNILRREIYQKINLLNLRGLPSNVIALSHSCSDNNKILFSQLSTMNRPTVYVTREITRKALSILEKECQVKVWSGSGPVPREELLKNVQGISGLYCMLSDRIDAEVLDRAGPQLKVIATMSVGFDHLDLAEIRQRKIRIGYTPDALTDATAELTIALLLATSRRIVEAHEEAVNGGWTAWSPFWMCGPGLKGSTVGIVGFGRIGHAVAQRLKAFNVGKILYTARSDKAEAKELGAVRVDLDQLLKESDFVSVHYPLTPETQGLFGDDAFKKMKNTAVFINTSRGGLVDQNALIRALETKSIWGAGLDVTTPEPLPLDSALFKWKNCVVLPHIGSANIQTRNEMADITAENIIAALKGEKMHSELL